MSQAPKFSYVSVPNRDYDAMSVNAEFSMRPGEVIHIGRFVARFFFCLLVTPLYN
jgi:hypothetical protein